VNRGNCKLSVGEDQARTHSHPLIVRTSELNTSHSRLKQGRQPGYYDVTATFEVNKSLAKDGVLDVR
jgi:hypothetical protein